MTIDFAWVHVDELRPWICNPRDNDRAVPKVRKSLERFGFVTPCCIDPALNRMVTGHTRLKATISKLADEPSWVPKGAPPGTAPGFVPVRFFQFDSEAEANAYALADNRLNEIADWSDELGPVLTDLDKQGIEIGDLGWSPTELEALLLPPDLAEVTTEDDHPEPPAEPVSERGVVYELGPHRLLCGDATDPACLVTLLGPWGGRVDLVLTDPPYAMYGSSTGIGADIADDKMVRPFFRAIVAQVLRASRLFGPVYLFGDWRSWSTWWECSRGTQLTPKNMLIWNKTSGLGTNWQMAHEVILYGIVTPVAQAMSSSDATGIRPVLVPNVLDFNRPTGDERQHNAAKPVALLRYIIEKTEEADRESEPWIDTIADLFGGSGSTLIAGAALGKRVALMEDEPGWCDVIRRRWTKWARERGAEVGSGGLE